MNTMSITIEGQAFEQGIPTSTLKALVDFQRVVYKAYAMKKGISVRALSREERQKLEIIFDIRKGCWFIDFFNNELVQNVLKFLLNVLAEKGIDYLVDKGWDYFINAIKEHYGFSISINFVFVIIGGLGNLFKKIKGNSKDAKVELNFGNKTYDQKEVNQLIKDLETIVDVLKKGDKK